jgi:hypothetical protein
MTGLRRGLQLLYAGVALIAIAWPNASTFIRLRQTPLDLLRERPAALLVHWMGALLLSLLLDRATTRQLRPFYTVTTRQIRGEEVAFGDVQVAAGMAIRLPARLMAGLGILIYLFSQRLLQPHIERMGLREVPDGPRLPMGFRILLVVVAQTLAFASYALTIPPGLSPVRLLAVYIPIGAITILGAYLVAVDTSGNLRAVADRLQALAEGRRPDLFRPLAVTGQDEVAAVVAAFNHLQERVEPQRAGARPRRGPDRPAGDASI